MNRKSSNIILLALSTFPGQTKKGDVYELIKEYFSYKDEHNQKEREIEGVYQLDPIPHLVHQILEDEGESINKVVMLCTKAVLKEQKVQIKKDFLREEEAQTLNISPVEFFKKRMREYCPLEESDFKVIKINEHDPSEGIRETIMYLREESTMSDPRLFVDTHGGFRSVQLVLEAILSLIKEDVYIDTVFGVHYGNNENRITNEDKTIDIFDFVTAMNAFFHYGRSEDLVNCLNSENDSELIEAIKTISEGIQLCDVFMFEDGLKKMDSYYKSSQESNHEYLKLFEETMKKDYESPLGPGHSLLDEDHTVVDEILWALRKGFFQQAITFVEARMPEKIFENHLLLWDNDYLKHLKDKVHNHQTYVFNNTRGLFLPTDTDEERLDIVRCLDAENYVKNIKYSEAKSRTDKLYFLSSTQYYYKKNRKVSEEVPVSIGRVNRVKLYAFLRLHHGIKKVRNHYNHCSPEDSRISKSKIEEAIKLYCKLFDELCS